MTSHEWTNGTNICSHRHVLVSVRCALIAQVVVNPTTTTVPIPGILPVFWKCLLHLYQPTHMEIAYMAKGHDSDMINRISKNLQFVKWEKKLCYSNEIWYRGPKDNVSLPKPWSTA